MVGGFGFSGEGDKGHRVDKVDKESEGGWEAGDWEGGTGGGEGGRWLTVCGGRSAGECTQRVHAKRAVLWAAGGGCYWQRQGRHCVTEPPPPPLGLVLSTAPLPICRIMPASRVAQVLENELAGLREKVAVVLDKTNNDDRLIQALRAELAAARKEAAAARAGAGAAGSQRCGRGQQGGGGALRY